MKRLNEITTLHSQSRLIASDERWKFLLAWATPPPPLFFAEDVCSFHLIAVGSQSRSDNRLPGLLFTDLRPFSNPPQGWMGFTAKTEGGKKKTTGAEKKKLGEREEEIYQQVFFFFLDLTNTSSTVKVSSCYFTQTIHEGRQ